ncbi:MAG: LUD domain-containing protein [Bacteroidota bacterium]
MKESTSKEKVLKSIRSALMNPAASPVPDVDSESRVFHMPEESLDLLFAHNLIEAGGEFIFCENETECAENLKLLLNENQWKNFFCLDPEVILLLDKFGVPYTTAKENFVQMQVGITACEYLVARLGSVLVSSKKGSGRKLHAFPPSHTVIAYTSQLQPDLKEALLALKQKYNPLPSMVSLITGPSRTADIEKTLIMGAHGPCSLYVFLIDDVNTAV